MKRFTLSCRGDGFPEGDWRFEPRGDGLNVTDANGKAVCWFPHREADDRFILPSFWRSIKYLGFTPVGGQTIWFESDRQDVAAVKRYLDEALILRGPEALQRLRKWGWLNLLGGLGCAFLGFLAIGFFFNVLGIKERRAGYAFAAMILVGIGEMAWGIGSLFRVRRLRRYLREAEPR